MKKLWYVLFLLPVALLFLGSCATTGGSLVEKNVKTFSHLDKVNSAEYKFLLDPALFAKSRKAGYEKVWTFVKALAEKNGYAVADSEDPYKEKFATKEYFDTKDYDLRNLGFIIRKKSYYKNGKPTGKIKYTGKFASKSIDKVVAENFTAAPGVKASMDIEENVSLDKYDHLKEYTDVSQKIKTKENYPNVLSSYTALYPKLADSGLPGNTPLIGYKAYSHTVVVGTMDINGQKVEMDMATWAHGQDDAPFVGEISYTLEIDNYLASVDQIKRAEDFLVLLGKNGKDLVFPNFSKYNGSKVRVLMNLPVK